MGDVNKCFGWMLKSHVDWLGMLFSWWEFWWIYIIVSCHSVTLNGYLCCSFRTLVRAHRKRRSTAGHGGFYVIFASVRRVSRPMGWGGVGQWWRSFGLDHVVDATPRIGVGLGWDSAACFSRLQKRKDESNRVRTAKNSETWARTKTGWRCDAKTK